MTDVKTVTLDDLVGEHVLDGVDLSEERVKTYGDQFEDVSVIRFRLDGKVYTAVEDPSDGYRSSMKEIFVEECPISNAFAPVRVVGRKKPRSTYGGENDTLENDTLELIDVVTGRTVLEAGTNNTDDYYPSFVGVFHPENMVINVDRSKEMG